MTTSHYWPGAAGTGHRCDSHDDITETRHPTPAEAEVIDLLEWNPDHHELVRLTLHDWRRVDTIAAALADSRRGTIPAPRAAQEPREASPGCPTVPRDGTEPLRASTHEANG